MMQVHAASRGRDVWTVIMDDDGSFFEFGDGRREVIRPGWLIERGRSVVFLAAEDDDGDLWKGKINGRTLVLIDRELNRLECNLDQNRVTEVREIGDDGVIVGVQAVPLS